MLQNEEGEKQGNLQHGCIAGMQEEAMDDRKPQGPRDVGGQKEVHQASPCMCVKHESQIRLLGCSGMKLLGHAGPESR